MAETEKKADRRVKTPTILQMEAVECGAACLAIVLASHGRWIPLEELRVSCGVSRDGSKASSILKAARSYGFEAKGFRREPKDLRNSPYPAIVFWNFNHFVVLEGFKGDKVYLNDPAVGPVTVTAEEFDRSFTGVILEMTPGPNFETGGSKPSIWTGLVRRLSTVPVALFYLFLTGLLLVVPALVVPTFARVFVDEILVRGRTHSLRPLLVCVGITAIVTALLTWIQQRCVTRLQMRLTIGSTSRFLWHVLRVPVNFFQQRSPGDVVARVQSNRTVSDFIARRLTVGAISVVTLVFYAVLMISYSAPLALVGMAVGSLNIIIMQRFARFRRDANSKVLQDEGKLVATASGGVQMIETLKATATDATFFSRVAGYQAKVYNVGQQLAVSSIVLETAPIVLLALSTSLVLGIGAIEVMDGRMSMGMLVAFNALLLGFVEPLRNLVSQASEIQLLDGNMKRLDDVAHYPLDKPFDKSEVTDRGSLKGGVELRGITYGYNVREEPLIRDFDLELTPGSRVALVGGSGSGKSTIAKLICGLAEPWSGEILFDGNPRESLPPRRISDSVAMVDQDIVLFEGSVRENLTLWDSTIPEDRVLEAGRDACIHERIAGRPDGYEGPIEEGGRNFSGGEAQRLEIARALVNDPSVLVLDEATSALDPQTEQVVDRNLRRRGCTCIIVAHRLSTIRDCDEIVVLEYGTVVERGTHEELMAKDGAYKRLVASE